MSPDLRATDVGHWYWFSLQLTSQTRKPSNTLTIVFFFFFCQKVTVSDWQLEKCSFNTYPELQHDKSLAVSLLAEIGVISNVDLLLISSSLLWKHGIGNQQWCLRWKLVWTAPAELTEVHGNSLGGKILIFYWSIFRTVVRLHYSPLSSQNPFPPEGKLDTSNYLLPQFSCSVFGMSTIWFRCCATFLP